MTRRPRAPRPARPARPVPPLPRFRRSSCAAPRALPPARQRGSAPARSQTRAHRSGPDPPPPQLTPHVFHAVTSNLRLSLELLEPRSSTFDLRLGLPHAGLPLLDLDLGLVRPPR